MQTWGFLKRTGNVKEDFEKLYQLIKDTMHDYGYLEHMGMGIPRKMFATLRAAHLPDPEIEVGEESTTVRLRWQHD